MIMNLNIEQVTSIEQYKEPLSDLLIQVVEQGASVGFLPPLAREAASSYWNGVLNPEAILWIAKLEGRVIGTVQLHLCGKPNGRHRAEIAKLMTLPDYQRQGIGRALMQEAEHRARREGRSLLVLDTRDGDPSNRLYTSIGYILAGQIPCFAKSADGGLDATNLYYKKLDIE